MTFERLAEEKIRSAQEAGAFENLPGAGKPLGNIDDEFAGDDWMGFHILRANGFLPEWLELRKQIAEERPRVLAALEEWRVATRTYGSREHALARRAGDRYRSAAIRINAKIDLHNLRCPNFYFEIVRFRDEAAASGA